MDPTGSRFWINEELKRSKNKKRGGEQDRNCRRKLVKNAWKWSNDIFCWKISPTLGEIISGTKYDRDKPNVSAEKGGHLDWI